MQEDNKKETIKEEKVHFKKGTTVLPQFRLHTKIFSSLSFQGKNWQTKNLM
ncbi:hypothetical protein RYE99_00120 [Wolbachia endosymbiont of Drosophila seguyi]|uniref:hypothetical protein n=1 Tax=Wolbachia endosymbiont of Drosophila seguyi TaxID=3002581 RepID=UPI0023A93AF3|nr:hypothetical protein [Wolbachia endosymbiont of Drosophila seguyi]MDE5065412.1 hypothetical protein [Wolbachia endosymbiont of Drosophila seguyi]MDU8922198.1 hypothetical protein [Wolbachia endosymbiont of Drosophila seguyi]